MKFKLKSYENIQFFSDTHIIFKLKSPVGCGCRIHRLNHQQMDTPPSSVLVYDFKPTDDETPTRGFGWLAFLFYGVSTLFMSMNA